MTDEVFLRIKIGGQTEEINTKKIRLSEQELEQVVKILDETLKVIENRSP